MQVMSDMSSQFEHLPLVDMPLLRDFARFDRNTNSGGTIEAETERDVVQAVNRIHHDSAHPSHLILPIIERD
jgi:predicted acyl esterase